MRIGPLPQPQRDPFMTISMYLASAPRIANALNNLIHLLDLAQKHVDA